MAKQPPENLENKIRNKLGPIQSLVEFTRLSLEPQSTTKKPVDWSKHITKELTDKCQRSIDQIIMIARIGDDAINDSEFDVNEHL